jgi:hypothetical protein
MSTAVPPTTLSLFRPLPQDDAPELSVPKQIAAARAIATERLFEEGISRPYPFEFFEYLGVEKDECVQDWNTFCALLTFTYWLGFATGQLVPNLQVEADGEVR